MEQIQELKNITVNELMKIPGIKEAKATTLIAAIELGRRLEHVSPRTQSIASVHDIFIMMKHLQFKQQEEFHCLYLDLKMNIIKQDLIYIGTLNQLVIHPRDIFKNAFKYSAVSIILIHNHPTGDPTPIFCRYWNHKNIRRSR